MQNKFDKWAEDNVYSKYLISRRLDGMAPSIHEDGKELLIKLSDKLESVVIGETLVCFACAPKLEGRLIQVSRKGKWVTLEFDGPKRRRFAFGDVWLEN